MGFRLKTIYGKRGFAPHASLNMTVIMGSISNPSDRGSCLEKAKQFSRFPTYRLLFSKFGDRHKKLGSCSVGAFMAEQKKDLGSDSKAVRTGPIANFPDTRSGTKPG